MPSISYARFETEIAELYGLMEKGTLYKMKQVLKEVREVTGVKTTGDIRPVTIARWIKAYPDRNPVTADSLLRSFRRACTIGVASGYMKVDPFSIKMPWIDLSAAEERDRHHSIVEVGRVLEQATAERLDYPLEWKPQRLEALVYVYAFAALRKSEALWLRRQDVDLAEGMIWIQRKPGWKPKTRASAAPVPIAPPLRPILERWLPETGSEWVFPGVMRAGPWISGAPGLKPLDAIKALGERAGIADLTIAAFRHSFATHARAWGIGELMLQAILRHTRRETKRYYLHADPADLRAAVEPVRYAG